MGFEGVLLIIRQEASMREKHCVVRPMTAVLVDSELSVIPVWYGWRGRTFSSSEHVPHFASLHVKLPSYRDNVMRSPNHLSGHDHQSLSFTKFCQKKNDVRSIHGTAYKYNKCQSRLSGPQPQVCRSVISISHQVNYQRFWLTHLVGSAHCFSSDFRSIMPKSWIRFTEPLHRGRSVEIISEHSCLSSSD